MFANRLKIDRPAIDPAAGPIDLAREQPFRLGSLTVAPALRELKDRDGTRYTIEPRVMQVLVALMRADGTVVSRDDLIRTCWAGTIVGEGSINRTISLLRKASEEIGSKSFRIETIPKVGYRLVLPDMALALSGAPPIGSPARPRRLVWTAFVVLGTVAAAATAFIMWRPVSDGPTYSVSVRPFGTSSAARGFDEELVSTLTSQGVPTAGGRIRLTLTGTVEEQDGTVRVNAQLIAPDSDEVVWSGAIEPAPADRGEPAAVAAIVGSVVQCTLAGANDAGAALPLNMLSGYARTCELGYRGRSSQGVRVARELTRRDPDFAAGWFALSHHAVTLYFSQPNEDPELREEALAAADKLIELRPNAQDGYVSKFTVMDPAQVVERERLLLRAIELEPIYFDGAQSVLGDFLMQAGRLEEAFQQRRAVQQQRPDLTNTNAGVFLAAAATGRWGIAEQALEQESARASARAKFLQWRKEVWARDWTEAERYMPVEHPAQERATIAAYRALASSEPAQQEAAAALVTALPENCCIRLRIELLTQLEHRAEAIALLDRYGSSRTPGTRQGLPFLWDPALRSLWYEPTYESFLRRSGWIDYWQEAGVVPDMCKDASPPPFCRLLAPS